MTVHRGKGGGWGKRDSECRCTSVNTIITSAFYSAWDTATRHSEMRAHSSQLLPFIVKTCSWATRHHLIEITYYKRKVFIPVSLVTAWAPPSCRQVEK